MEDASATTARKTNDVEKKLHSDSYINILEPGDHVLIRYLTERGRQFQSY